MTDTTEDGSQVEATPVVEAVDDGKTEAAVEQAAVDETTEGGTTVGPNNMDELLAEDADDLDMDDLDLSDESGPEDVEERATKVETLPVVEKTAGEKPVQGDVKPDATPREEVKTDEVQSEAPAQAKDGDTPATAPAEKPKLDEPIVEPAPVLTKEQQSEVYNKWRAESEELLATQHYQVSEEMAADLETDAAVAVPKLLSKVYLDSVTASVGHMISKLPAMIDATIRARANADASEERFFDHWKSQGLSPEHRDTVLSLGQAYRGVHPSATEAEFIRDVGAQTIVALGLLPAGPDQAPMEDGASPAFKPASTVAAPSGRPIGKRNPFDVLTEEMETEELDLD